MCCGMAEHQLTLRATVITGDRLADDYCVWHDGRSVGRIRLTIGVGGSLHWDWAVNPPLPIPSWANGSAASLEEAKQSFRKAWQQFYASLTLHSCKPCPRGEQAGSKRKGESAQFRLSFFWLKKTQRNVR
jgi:hypothetical protein